MEKRIIEALKELNIPAGNLGFTYLMTGIGETCKDEDKLRGIMKEGGLYDVIAKKHHTTISRAERAIRHAIEISFTETDKKVLKKYFDNVERKPTNKNFIATMALEIKLSVEA